MLKQHLLPFSESAADRLRLILGKGNGVFPHLLQFSLTHRAGKAEELKFSLLGVVG